MYSDTSEKSNTGSHDCRFVSMRSAHACSLLTKIGFDSPDGADTLDKWMKGTSALFVAALSHVDIVGEVEATDTEVKFRFDEVLAFNLPFVKPKVPLTGTLILKRGKDGLITDYKEIWDTDVGATLKRAYL